MYGLAAGTEKVVVVEKWPLVEVRLYLLQYQETRKTQFLKCVLSFTFSAIYGVATTPNDFATYLLAILIVNGLLYLAFYVIMKVLVLRAVLSIQATVKLRS